MFGFISSQEESCRAIEMATIVDFRLESSGDEIKPNTGNLCPNFNFVFLRSIINVFAGL